MGLFSYDSTELYKVSCPFFSFLFYIFKDIRRSDYIFGDAIKGSPQERSTYVRNSTLIVRTKLYRKEKDIRRSDYIFGDAIKGSPRRRNKSLL